MLFVKSRALRHRTETGVENQILKRSALEICPPCTVFNLTTSQSSLPEGGDPLPHDETPDGIIHRWIYQCSHLHHFYSISVQPGNRTGMFCLQDFWVDPALIGGHRGSSCKTVIKNGALPIPPYSPGVSVFLRLAKSSTNSFPAAEAVAAYTAAF